MEGCAQSFSTSVLRADDLLDLHFEFLNLRLEDGEPGPALVRVDAAADAFVIVTFPPQHVGEEAFDETLGAPDAPPVRALLAGPTRLAFRVPRALQRILFSIDSILAWNALEPSLAPGASASGSPAEPSATTTAIEAPFRLVLSPGPGAGWVHATQPVTSSAGWTELWHTRLASRTVRAIWSPDLAAPPPPDLPNMSLSSQDRLNFVRLSAGGATAIAPIQAERLMLSSLGAWLDVAGVWELEIEPPVLLDDETLAHQLEHEWREAQVGGEDPAVALEMVAQRFADESGRGDPQAVMRAVYVLVERLGGEIASAAGQLLAALPELPASETLEWRHRATQGRDNYVRVTIPGFLFPLGHRATLVKVTERKIERAPDGVPTAYLRQRQFIVVQEPFKDYRPLSGAYLHDGRESPFVSARVVNEVTPALDPPPSVPVAFSPSVAGGDFPWSVVLEDREQRRLDLSMPLVFMPAVDAAGNRFQERLAQHEYHQNNRQSVSTGGRSLAFAAPREGRAGEAALTTSLLVFDAQLAPDLDAGQLPSAHPRFLPVIQSADVRIPAVDALLGPVAATRGTSIVYDQTYLRSEFDANANRGQMFVRALDAVKLAFPAARAGGVARPNVNVDGISRVLGAVGDAGKIVNGNFDVSSFFPDAKILGFLSLKDLVAPLAGGFKPADLPDLAGLDPAALWEKLRTGALDMKVPAMTSRRLRDALGVPTAVETQHVWSPKLNLNLPPELDFLKPSPNAKLVLATTLRAPLDGSEPTFESRGELSGFALEFAGAVKVTVGRITFTARSGRKLDVTAEGVALDFDGPLEFVNTIRHFIPAEGFSDPPAVSVTPEGISAGYSLGLPTIGVGIFSLENVRLSAGLTLPFVDKPAGFRFALSERHDPFLVTVSLFGGGGFFSLGVQAGGPLEVEASIEFGGNIALDIIVASGGVHVMAGIYFKLAGSTVSLSGYLRAGGALEVLGLITITAEFYMALDYDDGKVYGDASLTVGIEILFFSAHVTLSVHREFAGAAGDPTFDELVEPDDWATYCAAFA
ncbi:MAG TPA: hypothetical protein VF223_22880 [Trebonia sp.]